MSPSRSRADSHLSTLPPALATDVITLLGNLIDNAVDVSVGSQPARVTISIDDLEGLTISVADSGPGVPEHLRESIFARGVTSKPDAPGGRGHWAGAGAAGHRAARRHGGGDRRPVRRRTLRGAAACGRRCGEGRPCVTC